MGHDIDGHGVHVDADRKWKKNWNNKIPSMDPA